MFTMQPVPDRMTVLARIDILAQTIRDIATMTRDSYGLARVIGNTVELAFPDCPQVLVDSAVRYADRVRIATALHSASRTTTGRGEIMRLATEASKFAESEAAGIGNAFEDAMREWYAPRT